MGSFNHDADQTFQRGKVENIQLCACVAERVPPASAGAPETLRERVERASHHKANTKEKALIAAGTIAVMPVTSAQVRSNGQRGANFNTSSDMSEICDVSLVDMKTGARSSVLRCREFPAAT